MPRDYVVYGFTGNRIDSFDSLSEAERCLDVWKEEKNIKEEVYHTVPDEQCDETTDDSNDTMYDFITTDDEEQTTEDTEQFNTVGSMWTLGDHSTASDSTQNYLSEAIESTMDVLDDDIDGDMKAVLQDASDLVKDTRVSRFECPVEACGLGHSHSDHKHDIRSAFNVESDFADSMQFCPYCHCGVNELSMLMAFFPYICEPVFTDQHQFEGVLEVEPDILNSMYQHYIQDNLSVSKAAGRAATEFSVRERESEEIPLGVREDIKAFFSRRRRIEKAAQGAPIAQETRNVIGNSREELEVATPE